MLTRQQIAEIARRDGVTLHAVERDYVQHLVLRQLSSGFIFKGGTSIRVVHGSPRYSEDLDFNANIPKAEVNQRLQVTARRLFDYGVRAQVTAPREARSGYLGQLRYEGPLFNGNPVSRGSIRLEVSLRAEEVDFEERFIPRTPYPDVPQLALQVLTPEHLFAEKTRALLIRKKPRDLYDVHFLLSREITSTRELIDKKMAIYGRRFDLNTTDDAVEAAARNWERDLRGLLGQVPPYATIAHDVQAFFHRNQPS